MINKTTILIKIALLISFSVFTQNKINDKTFLDSLTNKGYTSLLQKYYTYKSNDTILADLYIRAYISKSKKESDIKKLIKGYEIISYIHKNDIGFQYVDSIIELAKDIKNDYFLSKGYIAKGQHFFFQKDFKNSLDYYLKSYKIAIKLNDKEQIHSINHAIGLLKSRTGRYQEALEIFKKNYTFYSAIYSRENREIHPYYFTTIFALSDAYRRIKKFDSTTFYNKQGYKESLFVNNQKYPTYFILCEGINQYFKKDYKASIDSLKKVIPELNKKPDHANLAYANSFIGKSLYKLGEKKEAIQYLKKVDDIYSKTLDIHPELRDSYEIMIKEFSRNGNKTEQLRYIEKLMNVDSTFLENYKYLLNTINKNYDFSILTQEKEKIIENLKQEKKKFQIGNVVLLAFGLGITILFVVNYRKRIIYKKRFKNLTSKIEKRNQEKEKTISIEQQSKSIGISEEIIEEIIEQLITFEKQNAFIQTNLTLTQLAKDFNTNSRYLSKIINTYKGKNFNNYINDLRIDYITEQLVDNPKLRNYTIKAIGKEAGFMNTESFTKSFIKKTGIYPSYFIKKLNA